MHTMKLLQLGHTRKRCQGAFVALRGRGSHLFFCRSLFMAELLAIQQSVLRWRPYGSEAWQQTIAKRMG